MTGLLHLDTHVVVWLAAGEDRRVSEAVRARLGSDTLRISPAVRLEIDFLRERGRVAAAPDLIIERLASAVGLAEDATPFTQVVGEAIAPGREWHNRDPFDLIITATAIAAGATLATKDAALREYVPEATLWD